MSNTTTVILPIIAGTDPLILYWPSDEPKTTPALTANLVCRIILAAVGIIICMVPLRLLHRNGEFAAVVLIATTGIKNLLTIVNALIWRNNDVEDWWPGYGLCDVLPYPQHFVAMLFSTCLLAIVRNIAHQVGLLRANTLTAREKRRRNLIQSLIMFPFPLLQLALTWFLTSQRYVVGTLVGCSWVGSANWVYIVFFVIPPFVAALITAGYAILIYFRYRELAKSTDVALVSNRQAHDRAQRTRRRLYFMVVAILIPFLPIMGTLAILNILDINQLEAYNYDKIHSGHSGIPWNTIVYLRSSELGFAYMNVAWISILATVPIFGFFGTTKDAINDYRHLLLFLGLGKLFPRFYQEYDPDRRAEGSSQGSSNFASIRTAVGKTPLQIIKSASTFQSRSMNSSSGGTSSGHELQSMDRIASHDLESGVAQPLRLDRTHHSEDVTRIPHRNPWLMRTHLNFPNIPFLVSLWRRNRRPEPTERSSQVSLNNNSHIQPGRASPPIRTRVWSEEEGHGPDHSANNDRDNNAVNNASIASIQGVFVETHLVLESHTSDSRR